MCMTEINYKMYNTSFFFSRHYDDSVNMRGIIYIVSSTMLTIHIDKGST